MNDAGDSTPAGVDGHSFHDMGGMPGGPIDRSEHELAFWEKRVHAMMLALGRPRGEDGPLMRVDEMRRNIEALGAAKYHELAYYERWTASIVENLIEKGVFTVEELRRKLTEIETRERA